MARGVLDFARFPQETVESILSYVVDADDIRKLVRLRVLSKSFNQAVLQLITKRKRLGQIFQRRRGLTGFFTQTLSIGLAASMLSSQWLTDGLLTTAHRERLYEVETRIASLDSEWGDMKAQELRYKLCYYLARLTDLCHVSFTYGLGESVGPFEKYGMIVTSATEDVTSVLATAADLDKLLNIEAAVLASAVGNTAVLQTLLNNGISPLDQSSVFLDISAAGKEHMFHTPLQAAASCGQVDAMTILLQNLADRAPKGSFDLLDQGITPECIENCLALLSADGSKAGVKKLLAFARLHSYKILSWRPDAVSPFVTACKYNNAHVARVLFSLLPLGHTTAIIKDQYYHKIKPRDFVLWRALMSAVQDGAPASVVKFLLYCGAPIDSLSTRICNGAWTHCSEGSALALAMQYGHANMVKMLIRSGANTEHPDVQKSYDYIQKQDNLSVYLALLHAGCDLQQTNKCGHERHSMRFSTVVSFAGYGAVNTVRFLVQREPEILTDGRGAFALAEALHISTKGIEIAAILLEAGLAFPGLAGALAALRAVETDQLDLVRSLVLKDIDWDYSFSREDAACLDRHSPCPGNQNGFQFMPLSGQRAMRLPFTTREYAKKIEDIPPDRISAPPEVLYKMREISRLVREAPKSLQPTRLLKRIEDAKLYEYELRLASYYDQGSDSDEGIYPEDEQFDDDDDDDDDDEGVRLYFELFAQSDFSDVGQVFDF